MNSHNRVYATYAFESAEDAEFPAGASVDEMADTLEAEVLIYPACFEREQRFATWMIWPTRLAPESKGLKSMFLKI